MRAQTHASDEHSALACPTQTARVSRVPLPHA